MLGGSFTLRRTKRLQDRISTLLGCSPDARPAVVTAMLRRSPAESTGYWLGLVVAVAIATMGLVLESVAIVIAAMLIAPLMTPIVALGMGLAVGSPFLVLRSMHRVILSLVLAVGLAALLVKLLPFHDLNREITSRTTPTILDLVTAAFCALAGVYASMRPSSDVASTAAGTSIGVSLVPPLCVSGFGIGIGSWQIAGGAALLFVTNFVAIVAVSTLSFGIAGFNQVDVRSLETEEPPRDAPAMRALARRLEKLFASGSGRYLRLGMPFVLVLALYFPLRAALEEVAWQVRARDQVRSAVEALPFQVIDSRARVSRGTVDVWVVLLGSAADSSAAERRLSNDIRAATGVVPSLEVVAVPDRKAFDRFALDVSKPRAPVAASAPLGDARQLVRATLERQWPAESAGALQTASIAVAGSPIEVVVVHVGPRLGPPAQESLERSLTAAANDRVQLIDVPIPREPLTLEQGEVAFATRLAALVEASRRATGVWICLEAPGLPDGGEAQAAPLGTEIERLVSTHPRVTRIASSRWHAHASVGPCGAPDAGVASSEAGADAGGD